LKPFPQPHATHTQGKYILFAIYTCSILAVIIVPATFAVAGNPTTGYILRAMGVCLAVVGTVGAINVPKARAARVLPPFVWS
jgi:FtsH-binding integral membrane protein